MNTETRPSIDQAVDGIEKLLKLAHDDLSLSFLNFWHGNKLEDKVKSILREYAQKENGALMEQIEHLTAEKSELVMNLEACEKERLEAVRKVVERDGLIIVLNKEIGISRQLIVVLQSYIDSIRGINISVDPVSSNKLVDVIKQYNELLDSYAKTC